jgi:hypothetical protein
MKIKLSPIYIFLILLIVLVLSVIFSSRLEGFISYNQKTPLLNQLYIQQYSDQHLVYKLYDSIYFDSVNGNIIELFGIPFNEASNNKKMTNVVDVTGTSLTDIVLMSRSNTKDVMTINYYNNSTSDLLVDKTLITDSIINTYNNYIHPNNSNFNMNNNLTYNYQVLYFSLGNDSIIHIYDCTNTNNVNIGTYLFRQSFDPLHFMNRGSVISITNHVPDNDAKNNSYTTEPLYDGLKQNSLFQLTKNILFDTTCRYLIVRSNNGAKISVYDGTVQNDGITPTCAFSNVTEKDVIKNTPSSMVHANFVSFQVLYINDTEGGNFILYIPIPSSNKTMIAVVSMDDKIPGFLKIINVVTFNPDTDNGLDGNTKTNPPTSTPTTPPTSTPTTPPTSTTPHPNPTTPSVQPATPSLIPPHVNVDEKTPCMNETKIPSLDSIISDYYKKYWNSNLPATTINGVKQYSNDFLLKTQIIPPICPSCPQLPTNVTCNNCGQNGGGGSSFLHDISNNDVPVPVHVPDISNNHIPIIANNPGAKDVNNLNQNYKSILEPQKPTFNDRITSETTSDNYSYYGKLPDKGSSEFIPITSDFSKFGR